MRRVGRWSQRVAQALAPALLATAIGSSATAVSLPARSGPQLAQRVAQTLPTSLSQVAPSPSLASAVAPPARAKVAPLVVVGLGDSVPLGRACNCVSYVSLTAQRLGSLQRRPPFLYNYAASGATSDDVWELLRNSTEVGRQIRASDLVVIEVGANDFDEALAYDQRCQPAGSSSCYASTLRRVRINLTQIVKAIRAVQTKPNARVVLVGYWNVFRDGAVGRAQGLAYTSGSDEVTQALNERLRQLTAIRGVLYADAYTPFKGDGSKDATPFLAPDADHPNAAGHALLTASVMAALGRAAATV